MSLPPLIVPVENQVRELDPKLLLAAVAAERGFPVVLGSRTHIHRSAHRLPRGVYLAKSARFLSIRMFEIFRQLGHGILTWDEEALVRNRDDEYFYRRRFAPETFANLSGYFAWGPDDAELVARYPHYPGFPIHVTGNPRTDVLRPELRGYFADEVAALRRRFPDMILVNTNFGILNHFVPTLSSIVRVRKEEETADDAAQTRGVIAHRREIFERFLEAVPALARRFPRSAIVVRPHPVESHAPWEEAARGLDNVHVVQEGNVVPWLLAARAMIHNCCTTGVEAYLLGTPSLCYRPARHDDYDPPLPTQLSSEVGDAPELLAQVEAALSGGATGADPEAQHACAERHMAAREGPLATERITAVLARAGPEAADRPAPPLRRGRAWLHSAGRAAVKVARARLPGNRNSADYQRHRFPEIRAAELESRVARLGAALSRFQGVRVRRRAPHIFHVHCVSKNVAGTGLAL